MTDPVQWPHGTVQRYRHGCPCSECRTVHSAYQHEKTLARIALPKDPNDPRHGTRSFYNGHGCRCEPCRAANRAYNRLTRRRP